MRDTLGVQDAFGSVLVVVVAVGGLIAVVVYLGGGWVARAPELRELLSSALRRRTGDAERNPS